MTDIRTDHANLAADVVLFATDPSTGTTPQQALMRLDGLYVLLIERGWDPFAGHWALPGRHVERVETFEQAARRELVEETGIAAPCRLDSLGIYDAPYRDPRGRVISVAFVGLAQQMGDPEAGDDAHAARWVPVGSVLDGTQWVAFDHAQIITDAYTHVRTTGWWWS